MSVCFCCFFFFKQKTAYEMRISDWSSDVCSSDLIGFEKVSRHARTIADIVAHIIGDNGGITRIILWNPGFHLADQVSADISGLGKDTAAKTGADGAKGRTEGQRPPRVDDRAILQRHDRRTGAIPAEPRDRTQGKPRHHHTRGHPPHQTTNTPT